jgi:hypothetical protein
LHVVFALHVYAFNLVLLSALLGAVAVSGWLGNSAAWMSSIGDHVLFAIYLLGNAAYLYVATHVAYGAQRVSRVLQTLALTIAAGASVVGYRFALFLITFYGT